MKLPKPYAVLFKQGGTEASISSTSNYNEDDRESNTQLEVEPVSYDIVAVVEKKICFNRRPMPAANKSSSGAKVNGSGNSNGFFGGGEKRKR